MRNRSVAVNRRAWTINQKLALVTIIGAFLSTVAAGIIGFTEHGQEIKELKIKTAKLEMQTPFIVEVKTLTGVFRESMKEFRDLMREDRENWMNFVRRSETTDKELSRKINKLELSQGKLESILKNTIRNQNISYQDPP